MLVFIQKIGYNQSDDLRYKSRIMIYGGIEEHVSISKRYVTEG